MDPTDLQSYVERYEKRLSEFGYSPQTLGWGKNGRQDVRFSVLAESALADPESSVLDIGCGFADLYEYLAARGWKGRYVGLDIVPKLLEVARERRPELELRQFDISEGIGDLEAFDYVIASGVFNAKLPVGNNQLNIQRSLANMFELARTAVCVDFMTTHVDFQQDGSWHTDPSWALNEALAISPRVKVRNDYMPYEFALFIYCDAAVSDRNVFEAIERDLDPGEPPNRP